MAILEKMRVKLGAFITVIIALALLAFIIDPDTLRSTLSMFSSKYDVGEVNGSGISAQEFQKRVDYYTHIYQLTNGATSTTEETSEMLNNVAWQKEIIERVLNPACYKAGFAVGNKEFSDMCTGENISPVISSDPIFNGTDGFDSDKVLEFVQNISNDASGSLQTYWDFLQDNITCERLFAKYTDMLVKSSTTNALQTEREVAENNIGYNIEYVLKTPSFATDTTIRLTKKELINYYKKVKSTFYQTESRDAEFVAFEILPSDDDKKLAKEELDEAFEEFKTTEDEDLKAFLARNSDTYYSGIYSKKGDLKNISSTLDDFAATSAAGSFLEPQQNGNVYYAAKVVAVAQRPDSVYAQYIPAVRETLADSLLAELADGADFNEVASLYIPSQNNLPPGDLGWITERTISSSLPNDFIQMFESKKGVPFKLYTNGVFFILRAKEFTAPIRKAKVAVLSREASAGNETNSFYYSQASACVDSAAGNITTFEEYAHNNNLALTPVNHLAGGAKSVGGYSDVRELSRWIFDAKEGEVSPILSVNNKYFFVAALKSIHKEGIAPLKEVAPTIKELLIQRKKVDKLAEECSSTVGEDLSSVEEIATALGANISTKDNVTFATQSSIDPVLLGAVAAAGERGDNSIIGPIKSEIGVYYFQITDKEVNEFYTQSDAEQRTQELARDLGNNLTSFMVQDAKVVDKRYKFY